jgi:hypothetical protein
MSNDNNWFTKGVKISCTKKGELYSLYRNNKDMQRKLLGIIKVDSDAISQLLIIYSVFVKYLRKNGNTMRQCISYLQTSRKLMIQLGGRPCTIFSLSLVSP